ncbi:MAG: hydroxymethylglutaryl-CoA lyase [Planctomycetota bacterium]|nr:hydroxymethylglutaryl-CoA lyase [Planctomycetota bacterium]
MSDETVRIVEVGPRDGLQSRGTILSVDHRIEWIRQLSAAGLCEIEAGSFVRPDLVPAMASSDEVFRSADHFDVETLWALIPNLKGYQRASSSGATAFAFFTAASESFSSKNAGCSIGESLAQFGEIRQACQGSPLRAYLSCSFGCPYEQEVEVSQVLLRARQLDGAGADEIVISDTIGSADPPAISSIIEAVSSEIDISRITLHLHDTHGSAVECARAGLAAGIRSFDSSAGGLGGCPFAPGSRGNVATEDLVSLFTSQGFDTGIDLNRLIDSSLWLQKKLGESLPATEASRRRSDPADGA